MFLRVLAVVVQTIFFVLVFAVGSFLPGIAPNTVPMWRVVAGATHYFVWDGPIVCFLVYVLVLAIEAVAKRFRSAALITTVSFVLAFLLALAMKLPFMDRATTL